MGKPKSNGLVVLVDERAGLDSSAWNCMDFQLFECRADDKSWEASHRRFLLAKSGRCPYRDMCARYKRTVARRGLQMELNFE